MSEERDTGLETLFAAAQQELVDESFTSAVTVRLQTRGRRVMIGRLAILALVVALEFLLDAPLQNSVGAITGLLSTELFVISDDLIAHVMAPVNSIAGLIGVGLITVHFFYRKFLY